MHDSIAHAGTVNDWWYANHVEAVYCIEGVSELLNPETGETHRVVPGTLHLLDGHDPHRPAATAGRPGRTHRVGA
ncbi:MAG: hypothetical protein HOY78_12365 [Saccharothrix sp.]|nr:hypothetical protein [Saccharothrix sp.]